MLLNHISVREWEKVESLDCFHLYVVILALILFILEDLIGLDECVCLVYLILRLVSLFFEHLLTLVL